MQTLRIPAAIAATLLGACAGAPPPSAPPPSAPPAHTPPAETAPVASPDWRAQVIYFAMIDRFDDGDPANNDQGADEYDPSRGSHYSGGDFAGLTRRLDYLQQLGATALWITPPVANQWWNPSREHTGYHGYWASDFSAVDAHYGTLADYRALAAGLRARDMHLVQDIVVNHTGDWFGYDGSWRAGDAVTGYVRWGEGTRARGHEGTRAPRGRELRVLRMPRCNPRSPG